MPRFAPLVILLLLVATPVATASSSGPDATLDTRGGRPPPGIPGWLEPSPGIAGERIEWNLTQTDDYRTLRILLDAHEYNVERARQIVPTLEVDQTTYPLFVIVSFEDVWTIDSPAQIVHVTLENGTIDMRLGIPGPVHGRLVLTRDVTSPRVTIGAVTNLTQHGFYQETRTDELAIVDLQVKRTDRADWVTNPTIDHNTRQRFPISGLDPGHTYATRLVATDWAENNVTLDLDPVTTPPSVPVGHFDVLPVTPSPNASIPASGPIRAQIDPSLKLADNGIRFFLDKTEVREDLAFANGTITYEPRAPLSPGPHSVSVEVTDEHGATGVARWTFSVAPQRTPQPSLVSLVVAAGILAFATSRKRS